MIKRNNRGKIVVILVCFLGMFAFSQDKQVDEDKTKKLREEVLAVYQSKGEQGLPDFMKKQKDKISNKFIVDFAKAAVKARNEEWLKICKILAEEKKDEKTLADVLYNTGKYFSYISKNKGAIDYFDKAIPLYLKSKNLVGQGNVNLEKANICYRTGENSNALDIYEKALVFFEKARFFNGQANVNMNKGSIFLRIGENSKALIMFDKALFLFEKAGDMDGKGNVYLRKGMTYFYIGDNSKALEMYDNALYFFKRTGNLKGQSNIYESKGDVYFLTGKNSKAIEMYDKALQFYVKSRDTLGQGNVYISKGHIYSATGENAKAFEMYDKALLFYEKLRSPIGQGNVHQSKGDIFLYTGNNLRALEMYEKALPFYEKAKEPRGQGNIYLRKGEIFKKIGEYSVAIELYNKALPFFKKAGDPIGQGNVYNFMGDMFFDTGNNLKAVEMYDKALPFFIEVGNPTGQGNVYLNKGNIYFNNGDNLKAVEMYDKALPFFIEVGNPTSQGNVYRSKGNIYFNNGDNLKAVEMYDSALLFYKKTGDIESESLALHSKAKALVKLVKKGEALELFERVITNLEKVRMQIAFSEMKRTFLEKVSDQYEETVLFMLENKYYYKAFKYAESMRGRVLLDQMAEGLVRLEKGLKAELKEERDRLVGKLSALSRQIQETGGKDEKKLQELKEEYHQLESQFEDLLIKIRLENPLYASVNYPQPVTVRELQTEVLKKGETLLSFFISPEKAYVFIVSREKFRVKQLKVKEKEINGYVERYLHAIKENNTNDVNRFGSKLYGKLFKPLENYLKENRDIIIVPSGKLETIPFESLIIYKNKSGQPVYLLGKYRLKYVQSASLMSILRKHYSRDNETQSFIGFGDPVYDWENFKQGKPEQGSIFSHEDTRSDTKEKRLTSVSSVSSVAIESEIKEIHRQRYARAGGIKDRLPYSGEEIKTIARLFEKESLKTVVHLREQAAEANAKAVNMKDFDYIHFSCHGLLNDDFQSLVLSQLPPDKSKEDGYFTLNEIMNCDYHAKLVVLSACETGSGKMYKGEGVTGLTRAVMYAGTPAVIASLWKVDDIATKELMVKFYKNLLENNLDKTKALRQAKLELLKNKKYHSPLFWSAFVMYGE